MIVIGSTVDEAEVLTELALPEHESAVRTPRSLIYGHRIMDVGEVGEWLGRRHVNDLFRLETRDTYTVESDGEDYLRYLSGEAEPMAAAKQPWLDKLAADTRAGRIRRKVHLVRGPLTDYERYEFEWGFAYNVVHGEQVRVLELGGDRAARTIELGDFFVLDGEHVLRNHYDDSGRFRGAQVVYGAEAAALRAVSGWIWDAAEPFTSWWNRHPRFHRDP